MYGFERLIKSNRTIEEIKAQLETKEEHAYLEVMEIKKQLEEAESEAAQVKEDMSKNKSNMIGTLSYDPAAIYIIGLCHGFQMTSENVLLKVIAGFIMDYVNGNITDLEFHTRLAMELTNGITSMQKDDNLPHYLEEIYEF